MRGTYKAGDGTGAFTLTVDETNGYSRLDTQTGPATEQSGYDGTPWKRTDQILVTIDMPGDIANARAGAFLLRRGWRDAANAKFMQSLGTRGTRRQKLYGTIVRLPHASRLDLWFSAADHQLVRSVLHSGDGNVVTRYSNWHEVAGVTVPYRRIEQEADGETTTFVVRTVKALNHRTQEALAPPSSVPHRELALAPRAVPFTLAFGTYGQPVVPAEINGVKAHLIFDTGGANYFTPQVAKQYHLSVSGGINIGGVGSARTTGGYTLVRRLSIGPATLSDTVAFVAPLPQQATHPRPGVILQGLTGFQFLYEFRTEFDYKQHRIVFTLFDQPFKPGPDSTTVPFRTNGYSIFVEANVDGHPGWFRLDTGSIATAIYPHFARRYGLVAGTPSAEKGQVGGSAKFLKTNFRAVSLGGVTFHDVPGVVNEQTTGVAASSTVAGNIGSAMLSKFGSVTIDFNSKQVTFTPRP